MQSEKIIELSKTPDGFARMLRYAVNDQIDRIQAGLFDLAIPTTDQLFKPTEHKHYHSRPELFIQMSGCSNHTLVDGRCFRALPGSTVLIPRGVAHGEKPQNQPGRFCNIVCAYNNDSFTVHAAHRNEETDGLDIVQRAQIKMENGTRFYGYLNEICAFAESDYPPEHPLITGLMLTHLAMMREALEQPLRPEPVNSHVVTQCEHFLLEHLANSAMNVRWLADKLSCSPDYLSHVFSVETGITLTQRINNERLSLGRYLLEITSMNVSQIAASCGYRDPAYFTRIFTKTVGLSPRNYRRSLTSSSLNEGEFGGVKLPPGSQKRA